MGRGEFRGKFRRCEKIESEIEPRITRITRMKKKWKPLRCSPVGCAGVRDERFWLAVLIRAIRVIRG